MIKLFRSALMCTAILCVPGVSFAATPLSHGAGQNQTLGYGAGKILKFGYRQNYDCVEEPGRDLDFDKMEADVDPDELQIPICQAGLNPTVSPPGAQGPATSTTDPLYVLIPMFSVDNDQNPNDAISCKDVTPKTICGADLGNALIKFFGALPEAFKAKPLVYSQCPEPGSRPGTCTMHASRIDLAPVLAQLGYIANPPTANVFVPSPNHSHLLDDSDINLTAEWWQVLPVLVLDKADWPTKDGSSGITTVTALDAAEQAGRAVEAPSNFFLYFRSTETSRVAHMHH